MQRLENALNYSFQQSALLQQALTHRSYAGLNNERLEFLGDSVLNCVTATLLYHHFPALKEGELSRLRATLVRQESLAEIAATLNLGEVLRLGEGELKSGGFRRPSILADALEAIFGAIYLDGGFAAVEKTIAILYQVRIEQIDPKANDGGKDAKTTLQEVLQARHLPLPQYSLLASHGDAHKQTFEIVCCVPSIHLSVSGVGSSRRGAEQQAAQAALDQLRAL